LGFVIFLVPCVLMGALFSHLAWTSRQQPGGIGKALALNTLGATLAPLVFGVILLPRYGAKRTLLLVAVGYFALMDRPSIRTLAAAALAVAFIGFYPVGLVILEGPTEGKALAYREGAMAAVAVVADRDDRRLLKINNQYREGGTASGVAPPLEAHIPLLLHPAPRRALVLGVGAGVTVGAAADHPGLQVDAVELLPEVLNLLPYFDSATGVPEKNPAVRFWTADARRFVRASNALYDVV